MAFSRRAVRRGIVNVAISIASVLAAAIAIELVARVITRDFRFENYLGVERSLFRSAYPTAHDPTLGWVPKPGDHSEHNVWGTTVTIDEDGLRRNGHDSPRSTRTVLAIGDSFTFGDQVSDDETWPAALENLMGIRVLNGGVFAYGLDQSYLRALRLIDRYKPDILIFSFFPDDIKRCELSVRMGIPKPYFQMGRGGLELLNVPVPSPPGTMDAVHTALGHSWLVHNVMMRVAPQMWVKGKVWKSEKVHAAGLQVSWAILQSVGPEALRRGVARVIVLVQYGARTPPQDFAMVDYVTRDLRDVELVDLREPLGRVRTTDPDRYAIFFDSHMTRLGNEFVASVLADLIDRDETSESGE